MLKFICVLVLTSWLAQSTYISGTINIENLQPNQINTQWVEFKEFFWAQPKVVIGLLSSDTSIYAQVQNVTYNGFSIQVFTEEFSKFVQFSYVGTDEQAYQFECINKQAKNTQIQLPLLIEHPKYINVLATNQNPNYFNIELINNELSIKTENEINICLVITNKEQPEQLYGFTNYQLEQSAYRPFFKSIPISLIEANISIEVDKENTQSIQVWSQKSLEIEKEPEIKQETQKSEIVKQKKKMSFKVEKAIKTSNDNSNNDKLINKKKFSVQVGKAEQKQEQEEVIYSVNIVESNPDKNNLEDQGLQTSDQNENHLIAESPVLSSSEDQQQEQSELNEQQQSKEEESNEIIISQKENNAEQKTDVVIETSSINEQNNNTLEQTGDEINILSDEEIKVEQVVQQNIIQDSQAIIVENTNNEMQNNQEKKSQSIEIKEESVNNEAQKKQIQPEIQQQQSVDDLANTQIINSQQENLKIVQQEEQTNEISNQSEQAIEQKVINDQAEVKEIKKTKVDDPTFKIKKNQLTNKMKEVMKNMKEDNLPPPNKLFSLNVSNLNSDVIVIKDDSKFDKDTDISEMTSTEPEQQLIGEVLTIGAEAEKVDLSIFQNDSSDLIPLIIENNDDMESDSEIITDSIKDVSEKEELQQAEVENKKLIADISDVKEKKIDIIEQQESHEEDNTISNEQSTYNISQDSQQLTISTNNENLQNDENSDQYYQSEEINQVSDEQNQNETITINESEQQSELSDMQNDETLQQDNDHQEVELENENDVVENINQKDNEITDGGLVIDTNDNQNVFSEEQQLENDYDLKFDNIDDNEIEDVQQNQQEEQHEIINEQNEDISNQSLDNSDDQLDQKNEIIISQEINDSQNQEDISDVSAVINDQIESQVEYQENEITLENVSEKPIVVKKQKQQVIKKKSLQLKKQKVEKKNEKTSPSQEINQQQQQQQQQQQKSDVQRNVITNENINEEDTVQDDILEVYQNEEQAYTNEENNQNQENTEDCEENNLEQEEVNQNELTNQKDTSDQSEQSKENHSQFNDQKSFELVKEQNEEQQFEQMFKSQILKKKQQQQQEESIQNQNEQFQKIVNELLHGLEESTTKKIINKEQEQQIVEKIKSNVDELRQATGNVVPQEQEIKPIEYKTEQNQEINDIDEYLKDKEFKDKFEKFLKEQKPETSKKNEDRYYLDKPVNQAVSEYEKGLNDRKQEILEKIKNDLQIKKGRFPSSNEKSNNLSPYEFERIYIDWQHNKQDIVPGMLLHASNIQLDNESIEEEPQIKVERVSKKKEVEQEVQELLSNYKSTKKNYHDFSFFAQNQQIRKKSHLRGNKK